MRRSARGGPAKVTSTPRAVSSSATARAGSTCPAVPPAPIAHRNPSYLRIAQRDVKEDADRGEGDNQARAAVGDERQRHAGDRREPQHRTEVQRRLATQE